MKNEDIRPCDRCGGPLCGSQGPRMPVVGARVTVQRLAVNEPNRRQAAAMAALFPEAPGIQRVFQSGDLVDEPAQLFTEVLLCEDCICAPVVPLELSALRERAEAREVERKREAQAAASRPTGTPR